jgi:hypothetical protein
MRTDYGINSNAYRVRVLGEFVNVCRDQVVEEKHLEKVYSHGLNLGKDRIDRRFKRRMGIDPAYTGDDDTGVVIREGDEVLHVESWHGFDIVESFQRAKMLFDEWDCDVVHVDTVGVGAGLFDLFRHTRRHDGRMGYPAVRVMCSESSPEDEDGECAKLRDWLWWKCRKFFRTRNVKFSGRPEDAAWKQLSDEILAPTYKIANGRIKVEGKDEMKTRGLRSPNLADALNLTFFEDFELFNVKYSTGTGGSKNAYDAYRQKWKKEKGRSWKSC